MAFAHGFAEVLQVVGQSLLLLADVELLDVVYQLLLQPVLVVLHAWNLQQPVDDARTNLLNAALLVGLNRSQERLDIVDFLIELLFQRSTFLCAEVHQGSYGLLYSLLYGTPLVVGQHLLFGFGQHVGHARQGVEPVLRLGNAHLLRHGLQLTVVVLYEGGIHGRRVDARLFLYPDGKVHLSAFHGLGYHLAYFHLFLSIEWGDARLQVELLRVERFDFYVDFLVFVGYDHFAVACH